MGRIDLASFTCGKCGHKCTAPDAINAIPDQMEKAQIITHVLEKTEDDTLTKTELETLAATEKTTLSTKHQGNTFTHEIYTNETKDNKIVNLKIKFNRSYAKILFQSDTLLTNSKTIILGCPQCNEQLYHVVFPKGV